MIRLIWKSSDKLLLPCGQAQLACLQVRPVCVWTVSEFIKHSMISGLIDFLRPTHGTYRFSSRSSQTSVHCVQAWVQAGTDFRSALPKWIEFVRGAVGRTEWTPQKRAVGSALSISRLPATLLPRERCGLEPDAVLSICNVLRPHSEHSSLPKRPRLEVHIACGSA